MTDTLLSILILVGSPLLLILLHKIKIIDISYGIELLNNIKQGFISDYKAVKEKGITSILSNRWHLHALIGLGTVFTLALFKSISTMPFWQLIILIPLASFLIQCLREFVVAYSIKSMDVDFSDPRFGMYGSLIGVLIYGLLSLIIIFNSWLLITISLLIYLYVAYLVFKRKQ